MEKEDLDELDPFGLPEDDEETEPDPTAQAAETKELERLRAFEEQTKASAREAAIVSAFKEAGRNAAAAKLFATLNPDGDVTPEGVKLFCEEFAIGPEPEPNRGYTPTVIANERAVPAAKTYTRAEMENIARENPARARALAESGRVKWSNSEISGRPQR